MVSIAASPQSLTRMSSQELERANASVTLIDLAASLAGDPAAAELRDDLLREKDLIRKYDRDQQDFASLRRHFRYPVIIELRDQAIEHLRNKELDILTLAPTLSLRDDGRSDETIPAEKATRRTAALTV